MDRGRAFLKHWFGYWAKSVVTKVSKLSQTDSSLGVFVRINIANFRGACDWQIGERRIEFGLRISLNSKKVGLDVEALKSQ